MGFTICWLAVKGGSRESVHQKLEVRPTGQFERFPSSDASAISLNDWYIIVADRDYFLELAETDFSKFSKDCEIVFCSLSEMVMISSAECWKMGKKIWSVSHIPGQKGDELKENGEFPTEYASIKNPLLSSQDSAQDKEFVDYLFEIPVKLAETVTSFRHDRVISDQNNPFEVLIPRYSHKLKEAKQNRKMQIAIIAFSAIVIIYIIVYRLLIAPN